MVEPSFLITSGLPPIYSYLLENVPHCAFKAHLKVLPSLECSAFSISISLPQRIFILP